MTLVFVDTETTGLADDCDVWEIGLIARTWPTPATFVDVECSWLIRPDLLTAEPTGLRIGRYYERIGSLLAAAPVGSARIAAGGPDEAYLTGLPEERATDSRRVATKVAEMLDGATVVGAVPDFDTRHLGRFLRANGQAGTWHYHLVDVETLAAGYLGIAPPWGFDDILERCGLEYDEADRHTALGDARMVRDLYDVVLTNREPRCDYCTRPLLRIVRARKDCAYRMSMGHAPRRPPTTLEDE